MNDFELTVPDMYANHCLNAVSWLREIFIVHITLQLKIQFFWYNNDSTNMFIIYFASFALVVNGT